MIEAVLHSEFRVNGATGTIHWLQEEVPKREGFEGLWIDSWLRKNQLQFVSSSLLQLCALLRAHTDPIHARRSQYRPVGLDGDFEPTRVQRSNQSIVKLEEGLPACAHYEFRASRIVARPFLFDRVCQILCGFKLPTAKSIYTYEISVAELADSR